MVSKRSGFNVVVRSRVAISLAKGLLNLEVLSSVIITRLSDKNQIPVLCWFITFEIWVFSFLKTHSLFFLSQVVPLGASFIWNHLWMFLILAFYESLSLGDFSFYYDCSCHTLLAGSHIFFLIPYCSSTVNQCTRLISNQESRFKRPLSK